MLNSRLYTALVETFGEVNVQNRSNAGAYNLPPTKNSMLKRMSKERKYAHVINWGETYNVRCPVCDDHAKRLYISYLTGKNVTKSGSTWQFGRVAVCHNERCQLTDTLEEILAMAETFTDLEVEEVSAAASEKYMNFVATDIQLPKAFPLYSKGVPPSVHQYLWNRGFDPTVLARDYEIRYLPTGTHLWTKDDEEQTKVVTFTDRILIPIVQGLIVTGWQARVVDEGYSGKSKYLFPPVTETNNVGKQYWLYNKDKALFHLDMTICEGVTDVWKIGTSAVCTFGKTLSERQIYEMKLLWGWKGSCVICADYDAVEKWEENANRLRQEKVFPKGVIVIPFPKDADPADYDTPYLTELIASWRTQCHN